MLSCVLAYELSSPHELLIPTAEDSDLVLLGWCGSSKFCCFVFLFFNFFITIFYFLIFFQSEAQSSSVVAAGLKLVLLCV